MTGDDAALREEIRALAHPLRRKEDLDPLVARLASSRIVCLGEASHGTHEYYRWRAALSRRLIEQGGVRWIGVEGDWPDCWRINRWVRGTSDRSLDVEDVLAGFERWPTWMWANHEVAEFLSWLHSYNLAQPLHERVGFYGLDVYSLWDSLREIIAWLEAHAPDSVPAATRAWRCFSPYDEDPHSYAWHTRLVPESCEDDVVELLAEVRRRTDDGAGDDEDAFAAAQNAAVAADAEHYYRVMVRGDRRSWNVRDRHMADTVDRLAQHLGPRSRGLVWAHNTHVGDAQGSDMARAGLVTLGQLVRQRHGDDGVSLVGFGSHRGSVVAAAAWGATEHVLATPPARAGTHEDVLHGALGAPAVLDFGDDRSGPWLSAWRGHRAIGVVYQPGREAGNFVPTRMGARYDALLWFEQTEALHPLHHERRPVEPELETEPTGW